MALEPLTKYGWSLLISDLRQQRQGMAALLGWAAVEALPALLTGQFVALAVDKGFVAGRPGVGMAWLAALLAAHLLSALAIRKSFPALGAVVEPMRDAMLTRVVTGTLSRASDGVEQAGASAVSRLTQQVETVRDVTAGLLLQLRRFLFSIVAAMLGLLTLDPAIALIALPPVLVALGLFGWLMGMLIARQRAAVLAEEAVAGSVGTVVDGVRDIVACGAVERMLTRVTKDFEASAGAAKAMGTASALRSLVTALGAYLPVLLVLIAAPWLAGRGVSVGEMLGAVTYLTASLEPALRTATQTIGASGLRLAVTLRRLAETCQVPPPRNPAHPVRNHGHELRLTGVTFAYGEHAEPVLRDLEWTVPAGTHVAIVGSSGIGKSTLANLICGVLAPRDGTIRLGGAALAGLAESDLRRELTLIPQEAYVFAGTLLENLCYLRPEVDWAELDHAVAALGARGLVERLGGYDAELDPGVLSAGERQLVALVRAYVSAARVLVLDEATCHLDPMAESRVETAFASRAGTLIVIAHRISSARRADRILLLDGASTHYGTHEDLLTASPLYADLVGHWTHGQAATPPPDHQTSEVNQPVEAR
ncbi:ABC transporter ATP-binding protein [Amycolatopsis lurida]